ncbi:MAG: TMEM175 family protein [Candidatus Velthaea sp.]|jgi:uncharacterized membrane protein
MKTEADPDAPSTSLSAERLASLSDGMFGVAMTLLVTTLILPVQALTGSAVNVVHDLGRALSPVVLSFAISGVFWLAQQRQLSMTRFITPLPTLLHFIFLFLIVLLPITTALSNRGVETQWVVMIYGTHLALLGLVNLLLWIEVRNVAPPGRIVGSSLMLVSLVAALAIGAVWPAAAQYFWYAGFVLPWIGRQLTRRFSKTQ